MRMPGSLGPFHIIGIGGIGMSAIAEVMQAGGFQVQGSDLKDGANLRRLAAKGIPVFVGHDPAHLEGVRYVVISSAVKPGNPEFDAAAQRGLPIIRRAGMLAGLMRGRQTICVTGTHGKTTTTSLIAWTLEMAGLDPSVISGGVINAWGSNARTGKGDWMVVEADESDGTIVKLPAQIGVITNIDPEHLDFYGSLDALHTAFHVFFAGIPFYGLAVAGIDHPVVRELVRRHSRPRNGRRLLTYGQSGDADVRLGDVRMQGGRVVFDAWLGADVQGGARRLADLSLIIPGHYNALNALAAIAVASELGIGDDAIRQALATFTGVQRRFTRTGSWNGVTIYDDYAHHPVEIEAVLKAARGAAHGRIIAVMQPHRFSRLKDLFDGFCGCFSDADTVIVAPVYAAGETPNGIDRDSLVEGVKRKGHGHVLAVESENALTPVIASLARPGDLVIGLGAGSISDWAHALPGRLSAAAPCLGAAAE